MSERTSRTRKGVKKFYPRYTRWSIKEKKLLLQLLKKHSPNDIDIIQKELKTKTKDEICNFIERIKFGAIRKNKKDKKPLAPIEHWLWLIKDLTADEKVDYTQALGRVLSIAGNFEDHPPPSDSIPNYCAIYSYLSALLMNEELPELGPLESLVLLDQLHNLVDVLRTHDSKEQRKLMMWKYKMLGTKVDMANPILSKTMALQALENDFSGNSESLASQSNCTASQSNCTASQSNCTASNPESQNSIAGNVDLEQSVERSNQGSDGVTGIHNQVDQGGHSTSSKSADTSNEAQSDLSVISNGGESSSVENTSNAMHADLNQGEVTPNSNRTVSEVQSDRTILSKDGQAGLAVGMSNGIQDEAGTTSSLSSSTNVQSVTVNDSASSSSLKITNNLRQEVLEVVHKVGKGGQKRKRGRPRLGEEEEKRYFKKPALFTLNPFCIPINLLKMKCLIPEKVMELDSKLPANYNSFKKSDVGVGRVKNRVPVELNFIPILNPSNVKKNDWFQPKGKVLPASNCMPYITKHNLVENDSKSNVAGPQTGKDRTVLQAPRKVKAEVVDPKSTENSVNKCIGEHSGKKVSSQLNKTSDDTAQKITQSAIEQEVTMFVTETHHEECTQEEQEKASAIMAQITQEIMAKASGLI